MKVVYISTITFHRQVNMIFHLQELLVVFPRTKLLVDYLKQSLDKTSPSPVACLNPYKWFWFSLLCTVMTCHANNRVKVVNSWYVYSRTVFKIVQNLLELHGAKEERLSFFSALPCLPPTSHRVVDKIGNNDSGNSSVNYIEEGSYKWFL